MTRSRFVAIGLAVSHEHAGRAVRDAICKEIDAQPGPCVCVRHGEGWPIELDPGDPPTRRLEVGHEWIAEHLPSELLAAEVEYMRRRRDGSVYE